MAAATVKVANLSGPGDIFCYQSKISKWATFATLGLPHCLKTDNGTADTSTFAQFCATFAIVHTTDIPYNSTGQAIAERAHCTLQTQIAKQGDYRGTPATRVSLSLYTLNFLN